MPMREHTFEEKREQAKFEELRKKEEEEAAQRFSEKIGIPYVDLSAQTINAESLSLVDEETSRRSHLAVIQKSGSNLKIAVKNPKDPQTMLIIENLKNKGFIVDLFLVSGRGLDRAWGFYALLSKEKEDVSGAIDITPENLERLQQEIHYIDDFKDIFLRAVLKNATAVIELIIAGSLALDSSDVHIEPREDSVMVRFRVDGVLKEVATIDKKMYALINSRIKVLSRLKLNVTNSPQDGRFSITASDTSIEVRTSVLPGPNGESLVLRILNPKAIALSLEDLGLLPHDMELITKELARPNGLILVTGPTGSGKTTTLYAFLKKINSPEIKIVTIEDPIEYHIVGISQSQTNPEAGYTFSSGLRSILRQDPDVLLVGEIRDMETADISLHAALTGHLVFSTLHTNDAPSAILRLIDMDLSPNIIAPAINVLIAQRLVRKVCVHCSTKSPATPEEIQKIRAVFADLSLRVVAPTVSEQTLLSRSSTCKLCNNTGYKGRIGLYEMFVVGKDAEEVIIAKPTQSQLWELARRSGMVSIKQDGFLKVLTGLTTLEEIESVTG
ncbi:MAG: GspE/PulE family protein [Patescibacteria group bacterium]